MVKQKGLDWEKYQFDELEKEIDSLAERKKVLKTLRTLQAKVKKHFLIK